jgi:hypothetical protein
MKKQLSYYDRVIKPQKEQLRKEQLLLERRNKRILKEKKEDLINAIKENGCELCGDFGSKTNPLHFHHYKGLKDFNISDRVELYHRSLKELIEELSICKCLCKSCHTKEHYRQNMIIRLLSYPFNEEDIIARSDMFRNPFCDELIAP